MSDFLDELAAQLGSAGDNYAAQQQAASLESLLHPPNDPRFGSGATGLVSPTGGGGEIVQGFDLAAGSITQTEITDGSITTPKLAANAVTADKLAATFILASLIQTAAVGNRRVEIDSNGIRLLDAGDGVLVNIPTSGDPVYVAGQIQASSFLVLGDGEFRGSDNAFAAGSMMTLRAGISNPSQAPALVQGWDSITLPADGTYDDSATTYYRQGLAYDAAGGAGGATKVFWTIAQGPTSGGNHHWYLLELLASNRTVNRTADLGTTPTVTWGTRGVVRHGSYVYVLLHDQPGFQYVVKRYLASTLALDATYTAFDATLTPNTPALGLLDLRSDGTNLFIPYIAASDSKIKWNKYNDTMVKQGATIDTTYAPGSSFVAAYVGSADFGAFRVCVMTQGGNVDTFDSTGARQANEQFPVAAMTSSNGGGLTYGDALGDGARFWSVSDMKNGPVRVVTKHTTWTWTTASSIYWVAYSWYDSVGTTHESQAGPRASITMGRRKQLQVTCAPLPGSGGVDEPGNHRVYMLPNATDPGLTALKLQATTVADLTTLTTYNSGGAADPGSNGFPSGTPAEIKSSIAGWSFTGDGLMSFGGTVFPTGAAAGDQFFRTDLDMWFYRDGTANEWLSVELRKTNVGQPPGAAVLAANQGSLHHAPTPSLLGGSDIWLVSLRTTFIVLSGGTALGALNKWVGTFAKRPAGNTDTTLLTVNIDSGSSAVWRPDEQNIGAKLNNGTLHYVFAWSAWTKTGTPGNLFYQGEVTYRIVAT